MTLGAHWSACIDYLAGRRIKWKNGYAPQKIRERVISHVPSNVAEENVEVGNSGTQTLGSLCVTSSQLLLCSTSCRKLISNL